MIKTITIQNFRGIKELKDFELKNLSLLVGENGTSKTSILEAINFCLSPYFLSGRIKHTDFYKGEDVEIKIILEFDENFKISLPDGYTKQEVECNKVCLDVKKRDRVTPKKAFSDIVVVSHYVLPNREKDNVKDGSMAMNAWKKLVFEAESESEKAQIKKDMLEYCKMDTWAMVRIYEELLKLI